MSFYYLQYLSFKKSGEVTMRIADSSLRPLRYSTVTALNLKEEGKTKEEFLKKMAVSVRDGNYHISGSSCKILAKIEEAIYFLRKRAPYNFAAILKDEDFGNFVVSYIQSSDATLDYFKEDFKKYLSLEYIREALIEDSNAWSYLPEEYRSLEELAKFYVDNCADTTFFSFPSCLLLDKEYILKAVRTKGVNFREFNVVWGNDKEVVYEAFASQRWPEHLPDLIGEKLLKDKEFLRSIIIAEPKLHWERFPKEVLADPYIAKQLEIYNVWYQARLRKQQAIA